MICIGIDVGGTSIKGAAVDEKGKLYERFVLPVDPSCTQNELMSQLIDMTRNYINSHDFGEKVCGIGLGIPGLIDSTNGIVTFSDNLRWEDLHVAELFEKELGIPTKISNDANAAALGETIFGAGKKYKNTVVMLTLGTGVGGGVVINGKIFDGNCGAGAELGHTSIVYNGVQCACGRRGCLEAYASANALTKQTIEAMEQDKKSLMWEIAKEQDKITGIVAWEAEKKGDPTAKKVIDQYISYLGEGILDYCNIFRPECIVLSGGVAKQGTNLTDRLVAYCEKQEYGYPRAPKTEIKVAELGYDSGIIGAACILLK